MPRAVLTQLMFEGSAEEAMNLSVSLFNGSVQGLERYAPGEQGAEGSAPAGRPVPQRAGQPA